MAPPQRYLRSRAIDRLSTLPPELLLMITSYLPPETSDPRPSYFYRKPPFRTPAALHRQFLGHSSLLALSRTCKHAHRLLTPELIKDFLAVEERDPLGFAIERAHMGLAVKLLEEKYVEATEERLLRWIEHYGLSKEESRVKDKVVKMLVELGAVKRLRLGKDWHAMMDLRWPGR